MDATKANLFFAKGLIMVEGDAENILVPAIAQLIGLPLTKYGVSVVNVGSTAYKRYVSIFKRRNQKPFELPIAVISDLDVRALEYYDDSSNNRKTPKYWLKETLQPELERISREVNYDAMASVWKSISAFERDVKLHKRAGFKPGIEKIQRMKDIFTDERKTALNENILLQIREERRRILENATNKDKIKIFLPNSWTLEYEIAGSGLFRLLATAIKAAQKEESDPEQEVTDEIIMQLWDDVTKEYSDGYIPSKEDAYKIFEPLNDGDVSKAITAQYLAGMILGELPPIYNGAVDLDNVRDIVQSDNSLQYLVDAIKHVTQ